MSYEITFGFSEAALLFLVSAQGTLIAYLHQPRWKILVYTIPIPFVFSSLVLARPIDATHAMGLMSIVLFAHAVRLLYYNARVPITAAIAISALAYCAVATVLVRIVPKTAAVFWVVSALAFCIASVLYLSMPHRWESGHRSPLPIWIKLPIICAVVFSLILAKQALSGFMAFFPMIGVITAYEARRSLWAVCRQASVITLAMAPTVATVCLLQGQLGLKLALLIGSGVYMALIIPMVYRTWFGNASVAEPIPSAETCSKP